MLRRAAKTPAHAWPSQSIKSTGLREDAGAPQNLFQSGSVWRDTDGNQIQAHAGSVLLHEGVYYWYGENKDGPTYTGYTLGYTTARVDVIGVSCYTSTDLIHWAYTGLALKYSGQAYDRDLAPTMVLERPKVIYNDQTRMFVMWMHIDSADYELARVGVATSSSPTGPFVYQDSFRPHGQQSRDLTVFKDDDGAAYIAYSSEDNAVMHISQLTPDYTHVTPHYIRSMARLKREAPAMFKHDGLYYMLTSGCTGWEPNRAEVFYATHPLGEWRTVGSPCTGATELEVAHTYFSQANFVLPVAGQPGHFIFMADAWDPDDLGSSRYVWLPMWVIEAKTRPPRTPSPPPVLRVGTPPSPATLSPVGPAPPVDVIVRWFDVWQLSDFKWQPRPRPWL
ncbi:hypothetical protein WJX72_000040 [[Myrmecia] bisecta]|uniref:Glycosyl hydrolase family 43 n=1 Tax=[Myrmecia] bisecta TaxID=41462 RepID=A0AAW1R492_9CHLO